MGLQGRNYWARDLPVRRGFFNFDRVVYRYYRDDTVATEAFKAGQFALAGNPAIAQAIGRGVRDFQRGTFGRG